MQLPGYRHLLLECGALTMVEFKEQKAQCPKSICLSEFHGLYSIYGR